MMQFSFDAEEDRDPYHGLPRVTSIIGMINVGDKDAFLKDWAGQKALESCLYDALWEEINADPGLIPDIIRAHKKAWRKELRKAGSIGTLAHKMIEVCVCSRMIQSGVWDPKDSTPALKPREQYDSELYDGASRAFLGWQKWIAERGAGFDPIMSEKRIRSEKLGYGGTIDCVAKYRGGIWIVDWKTSNRIDPVKFSLQGIAYKELAEKELGLKIDGIEIVRCDKKVKRGKYETMTVSHPKDFEELTRVFWMLFEIKKLMRV